LKLHRHCHRNWSGLVHSEARQNRPNLAVLIELDHVMLPIAFDVHSEID
jgi:hypothetical protein